MTVRDTVTEAFPPGTNGDSFPIHQTWKTTELPPGYEVWAESWRRHHPQCEYRLWTDEDNRDLIETHYSWFLETYDSYDRNIKRVDAVRYFYLHLYGGLYVDLDFQCLRSVTPLLEDHEIVLGRMGRGWGFKLAIPNAFMYSKPRVPFWESVFEELVRRAGDGLPEYETGSGLLWDCIEGFGDDSEIVVHESEILYPINWLTPEGQAKRREIVRNGEILQLISEEELRREYPASYAVTFWAHSWEDEGETNGPSS